MLRLRFPALFRGVPHTGQAQTPPPRPAGAEHRHPPPLPFRWRSSSPTTGHISCSLPPSLTGAEGALPILVSSTAYESPAKPRVLILQGGDGDVNYHAGGWEVLVGATIVSTPITNLPSE